jgi:hypothetical protein
MDLACASPVADRTSVFDGRCGRVIGNVARRRTRHRAVESPRFGTLGYIPYTSPQGRLLASSVGKVEAQFYGKMELAGSYQAFFHRWGTRHVGATNAVGFPRRARAGSS